jgi:ubiquinone/menaquinone biosynthesis C-methylase UbiE
VLLFRKINNLSFNTSVRINKNVNGRIIMSTKQKATKNNSYDPIAHLYSLLTGILFLFSGRLEIRMRKHALKETLPLKGDETILDLCSANGKGTTVISRMLSGGEVIGIDANPAMVAVANSKRKKDTNLRFKVGDCSQMPFPIINYLNTIL